MAIKSLDKMDCSFIPFKLSVSDHKNDFQSDNDDSSSYNRDDNNLKSLLSVAKAGLGSCYVRLRRSDDARVNLLEAIDWFEQVVILSNSKEKHEKKNFFNDSDRSKAHLIPTIHHLLTVF